jgi:LysM repeat protein
MSPSIGIKIANGDFYPILSEDGEAKKRLVLTTVRDGQLSVQIDLYRSATKAMSDAQPVGSLVVEDIHAKKKGEASIELVVGLDADGEISASAADLDNPNNDNSQLTVSLKTLTQKSEDDLPDFDLDDPMPALNDFSTEGSDKLIETTEQTSREKIKLPLIILIAAAVLLIGGLLWFFLFGGKALLTGAKGTSDESMDHTEHEYVEPEPVEPVVEEPFFEPPVEDVQVEVVPPAPPPVVEAPPAPPPVVTPPEPAPASVDETASSRNVRNPPVRSYKVPSEIPKDGVAYKIRWGDTLWDISQAFNRNPRLFNYLARYNNIRNPNRIISGRTIRIPPKPR